MLKLNRIKDFKRFLKYAKGISITLLIVLTIGFLLPQRFVIPVENATKGHWDDDTFWYYPWGQSIVHKGVDIFATEGTPVFSATDGFILSIKKNGKWRQCHQYFRTKMAHALLRTFASY